MDYNVRMNAFHVMAKPTGSACNLACRYCFFLEKRRLYPGSRQRMSDDVLEAYVRQYIEAQQVPETTITWQGGEPTMMGLDFFRRSVELADRHAPEGMKVDYSMQTNGILLDEEWCDFLRENRFLVGLSLDGPRELHDAYRVDRAGEGTFDRVLRAARLMQEHGVDFNLLCTVHAANAGRPEEVYCFFRDELGAQWVQFIPIVERINADGTTLLQEGGVVTERSVSPEAWGAFLNGVFDEWVRRDVGNMYINYFEAALASWAGAPAAMCIFAETCGEAMALEHNGDLYSCDHFVEPGYLLGNIMETPLAELAASDRQTRFGEGKRDTLPRYCLDCEVLFACRGECPKNRFTLAPDGEPGLNYLCRGYKDFFRHVDYPMRAMARLIESGRPASLVMQRIAEDERLFKEMCAGTARNDPCPCGSGKKYKQCHGKAENV